MNRQKSTIILILLCVLFIGYYLISRGSAVNYTAATSYGTTTSTSTTPTPPEVVSSTTTDTSVIDTSNWKTYSNYELGFSMMYPPDLGLDTSDPSQIVMTFPKTYFSTVLKDDVTVTAAVHTTCDPLTAGGQNTITNQNITVKGINFVENEVNDVAAGNRYETITYDTDKNSACYRITFVDHGANGAGLYISDPVQIKKADAQHDIELAHVTSIFNQMLSTFTFIDTPAGENESDYVPSIPATAGATSSQTADASTTSGSPTGPQVILNSVNPTVVSVGDTITLGGSSFSGSDTTIWISDGTIKGILWEGMSDSDTTLLVKIPTQACTQSVASGATCPSYLIVRPGIYTVSVSNQNGTTDELYITVN